MTQVRSADIFTRVLAFVAAVAVVHVAPRVTGAAPALLSYSCPSPHDLVVAGDQITLRGQQTFDRVCVENGGTLVLRGPLRVGLLYVDARSRIANDGLPGYGSPEMTKGPDLDGEPGGTLQIVARAALIEGTISANGGDGYAGQGNGAAGGHVVLTVGTLTLHGALSAQGGAGGPGDAGGNYSPDGGNDGHGGTIMLATPLSVIS